MYSSQGESIDQKILDRLDKLHEKRIESNIPQLRDKQIYENYPQKDVLPDHTEIKILKDKTGSVEDEIVQSFNRTY
jgi:hypothetical protein